VKSILVIEDNALLADLITEVLQEEGYHVAVASDGQDGLQKLPQVKPDLVITDLMMPRVSGEEFCNTIQASPHFSSIPVLLMTAREEHVLRIKCKYDAFLAKPFDLYHLLGLVDSLTKTTPPTYN